MWKRVFFLVDRQKKKELSILLPQNDINSIESSDGYSLLNYTISRGFEELAFWLIQNYPFDCTRKDSNGLVPVFAALKYKMYALLAFLSSKEESMVKDDNGRDLLSLAFINNDGYAVKILIDNGFPMSNRDKYGFTPACYSLMSHFELISVSDIGVDLISEPPDFPVNLEFPYKGTLMHLTAALGSPFLGRFSGYAELMDQNGNNMLHAVLMYNPTPDSLQVAIASISDISKPNAHGVLPIMMGTPSTKFVLSAIGARNPLMEAILRNDIEAVKSLPELYHTIDKDGKTPLHIAVINGSAEIVEYLAKRVKCVPDFDQKLPIYYANDELQRLLLKTNFNMSGYVINSVHSTIDGSWLREYSRQRFFNSGYSYFRILSFALEVNKTSSLDVMVSEIKEFLSIIEKDSYDYILPVFEECCNFLSNSKTYKLLLRAKQEYRKLKSVNFETSLPVGFFIAMSILSMIIDSVSKFIIHYACNFARDEIDMSLALQLEQRVRSMCDVCTYTSESIQGVLNRHYPKCPKVSFPVLQMTLKLSNCQMNTKGSCDTLHKTVIYSLFDTPSLMLPPSMSFIKDGHYTAFFCKNYLLLIPVSSVGQKPVVIPFFGLYLSSTESQNVMKLVWHAGSFSVEFPTNESLFLFIALYKKLIMFYTVPEFFSDSYKSLWILISELPAGSEFPSLKMKGFTPGDHFEVIQYISEYQIRDGTARFYLRSMK